MDLTLPRNAFSARDAARAGDVWRALQDAAVIGSSRRGWPPSRYTREQCAFVVREQTVCHFREIAFGEPVHARTWVERFRRQTFTTRQLRLSIGEKPVAACTQEWVHVRTDGGRMRAARASDELIASFEERAEEPLVELPGVATELQGPEHVFSFDAWFTWMDPLDHANHPAYVDWCDEAISRVLHTAGLRPLDLQPVAERVRFKAGVLGLDAVSVTIQLVGRTAVGDAVVDASIRRPSGLCAQARLVRRLLGGPDPLVLALKGAS